ncbi:nucleoside deaminase [bacterium NHP-B]|nr:nucleoside deaminase [bacterium NHP-B]
MKRALHQAKQGLMRDEVPVGVVLYHEPLSRVIFEGHNLTQTLNTPLAHAEMLAIQEGLRALKAPFLTDCTLYVTLEPCAFCAAGLILSRVGRVVFGAYNPKGGALVHGPHLFDTSPSFAPSYVGGVREDEAGQLLQTFFQQKRKASPEAPDFGPWGG